MWRLLLSVAPLFLVFTTKKRVDILGPHSLQFFIKLVVELAIVRLRTFLRLTPDLSEVKRGSGGQTLLFFACFHGMRLSGLRFTAIASRRAGYGLTAWIGLSIVRRSIQPRSAARSDSSTLP